MFYEVRAYGHSLGITKYYAEAIKWFQKLGYYSRGEVLEIRGDGQKEVIMSSRPLMFGGERKDAVTPFGIPELQSFARSCKKLIAPKAKRAAQPA